MTGAYTRGHAAALYDEQCPFCRTCMALLLVWDRGRRLRPVAVRGVEAEALLPGMGEEERVGSWHLVIGERRWSAGDAAAPLLRLLPAGAPAAALAERFPQPTRRGYELVSRHRGPLGRLIPAPVLRRADAVIRQRS